MAVLQELIVLDSRHEAAAQCVVCGNDIAAGEGVTARYQDRTLRFKCPGCAARFEADPDRCPPHDGSPASEWRCD
ncbi:MAG: hypothetical protein IVW53_12030 [Chloroflexi bacterium]|nr:hypothetical protein [Chloroflexota bacterium]